jgi:hypothetical protein
MEALQEGLGCYAFILMVIIVAKLQQKIIAWGKTPLTQKEIKKHFVQESNTFESFKIV